MLRFVDARRSCGLLLLMMLALSSVGCSICCTPHYDMFPAYGGAWERTNRTHGRVGSVFEPAGARMVAAPQDYEDVEETPPAATETEGTDEKPDPTEGDLPPLPDELRPAEPALPLEAKRHKTVTPVW